MNGSVPSRLRRAAAVTALAALAGGCSGGPPPAAPAAAKPATVTAPAKEAELTSVKLAPDAEKRLGIVTVAVERKAVAGTRSLGGEIEAPSGNAVVITAPSAGLLHAPAGMPIAGAAVTKGQLLFRLMPLSASERDAPVISQQAVDTATARRDTAAKRVQRTEQLLEDGAASRRQLEEAQEALSVAEAELKAAVDRRTLTTRSGTTDAGIRLEAPQRGVIQAVHVREGQTVAASAPLVDLVAMDSVWVRVPVYAGEIRAIDPNAPARVLPLGEPPDAEGFAARPMPAPPSANPRTAEVDLYFSMTNTPPGRRFRPGERVAVRLTRLDTTTGLVVPAAALLHDAYGGTWVYVAREPHVYARVRVVVSDISGGLALLGAGPPIGARVVTDGAAELFGVEFGVGK
ncbi:MAG TPA: efflux RND transporter periplasmic adaptor subunit [Vicinamibacterales bacterium]|nr:efflux RND transporter periplasmic adaptor subunit [Vicinamibacterales bacterium]